MSAIIRILKSDQVNGRMKFDVLPVYFTQKHDYSRNNLIFAHLYNRKIPPCYALLPLDILYDYKVYWNERVTKEEIDEMISFKDSEESSNKIQSISDFYFC